MPFLCLIRLTLIRLTISFSALWLCSTIHYFIACITMYIVSSLVESDTLTLHCTCMYDAVKILCLETFLNVFRWRATLLPCWKTTHTHFLTVFPPALHCQWIIIFSITVSLALNHLLCDIVIIVYSLLLAAHTACTGNTAL